MRLIVELFDRVALLEFHLGKATVTKVEVQDDDEKFECAPVDPHSVGGGQVERGPGADSYTSDVTARRFGFRGSQS